VGHIAPHIPAQCGPRKPHSMFGPLSLLGQQQMSSVQMDDLGNQPRVRNVRLVKDTRSRAGATGSNMPYALVLAWCTDLQSKAPACPISRREIEIIGLPPRWLTVLMSQFFVAAIE
jgi:hypothetical protein